jgi:Dipeptidyl aminopeptidases/acylaminoacyl-peptidases
MKKHLFSLVLIGLLWPMAGANAQQKSLTQAQVWDNSVQITQSALRVVRWDSDKVYLTDGNPAAEKRKNYELNAKNGKMQVFEGELPLPIPTRPQRFAEDMTNATPSPDGQYVAYTKGNDLYTLRLSDNKETRLTFDGSDVILNGYASWVYMEEILGRSSQYKAFWWSPDSKRLAFFRADDTELPLFTITDSPGQNGYVEKLRYPKPGNPIPQVKTGIVSPEGGTVVWAQVDMKAPFYFALPYWRPDGQALWLQCANRNQNHLQIVEANLETGATRLIYEEQQKTWISIDDEPRIRFLESGKGFILSSDQSGWEQLYLHDMNGALINPITSGDYTVLNVLRIDEKEKALYFTCYKDNIGCQDFYRVGLDGKNLQRLSFGDYTHSVSLSPDGKYFVSTYSNVETPPQMALYTTKGKLVSQFFDSKTENFDTYQRPRVTFEIIKSADGKFDLPIRIVWPLNMKPGQKYPVRLSVYGGPGSMSARNGWANIFGGAAHQYAEDGLIQATIDHRGSGHNGKVGQNYMHRNLGYWEMQDYTTSVQWLVQNAQADPSKVMITGFSYGGYISAYALTYGVGTFTHGFAGGSVVDWTLYDATYTERFMDTPQDNPEGYKSSSVFTHAHKLQDVLLLSHGLRDENVHAQNTFQLVSLLQELGKDFTLMLYPESRHGYRGKKSAHYQNLEIKFIYNNLLGKPIPAGMLR